MKFTPEFIQQQREIYSNAPTNVRMMAGADGNNLGVYYGYDEDYDVYETGLYAEFGHPADAKYAHEALSNYPDALAEIERLTPPNNRIFVVLPTELSEEQCKRINDMLSAGLLKAGFCTVCDEGDDLHVLHYYQCAMTQEE